MAVEFTIPEILNKLAIRGYSPGLASSVNTLLTTRNEIEYQEALKEATQEITGYQLNAFDTPDTAYSKDTVFGLPIYMPLLFEKIDNMSNDLFLDSAVVTISRTKNIIVTNVQGRDHSVKEFINNGDYNVSIEGFIAGKGANYPREQVEQLEVILNAKQSLKVVNEVFQIFGIHELVITDYELPPMPMFNIQRYEIAAISEKPIEMILEDR